MKKAVGTDRMGDVYLVVNRYSFTTRPAIDQEIDEDETLPSAFRPISLGP
jgi:hypothetical protein